MRYQLRYVRSSSGASPVTGKNLNTTLRGRDRAFLTAATNAGREPDKEYGGERQFEPGDQHAHRFDGEPGEREVGRQPEGAGQQPRHRQRDGKHPPAVDPSATRLWLHQSREDQTEPGCDDDMDATDQRPRRRLRPCGNEVTNLGDQRQPRGDPDTHQTTS
ncbi:hypothetical protein GCM10027290_23730 [Micromonospora sonneratiae]